MSYSELKQELGPYLYNKFCRKNYFFKDDKNAVNNALSYLDEFLECYDFEEINDACEIIRQATKVYAFDKSSEITNLAFREGLKIKDKELYEHIFYDEKNLEKIMNSDILFYQEPDEKITDEIDDRFIDFYEGKKYAQAFTGIHTAINLIQSPARINNIAKHYSDKSRPNPELHGFAYTLKHFGRKDLLKRVELIIKNQEHSKKK